MRLLYTEYGPPDDLQVPERPKPRPEDDELLVKIHAVEATKADCELRSFHFAVRWFSQPLRVAMGITNPRRQILGGYFAGEVGAVGKDVTKFKRDDHVFGTTGLISFGRS